MNEKQSANKYPSTKGTKTKQNSFETVQIQEQLVDEVVIPSSQSSITFKIVVIGQSYVGKTSLIKCFMDKNFDKQYNVTVGAEFVSKVIKLENGQEVKLNIWDTCGHDVFRSMTSSFYRGAAAAFLIFSIGNRKSFDKIRNWYHQFYQNASPHACIFLIGTKVDSKRQVQTQEAMKLLKQLKGVLYVETSSQTGQNVYQGFKSASEAMYKMYKTCPQFWKLINPLKVHGSFLLSDNRESNISIAKSKKKCC